MCVNAGGISQTLYNIFSFCKPEDILCIAPQKDIDSYPPTTPFESCYIGYQWDHISLPANRITQKIKPLIDWINYSINQKKTFRKIRNNIRLFNPDIAISCPNGGKGIVMHCQLLKGFKYPIIPYFMDDWMYNTKKKWLGGNLHDAIKTILQASKSWMMISEELGLILKERYDSSPQNILAIRNPVLLNDTLIINPVTQKSSYTLAYAGALWPMHYDSFLIIAKAVNLLSITKNIQLVLYSGEQYWRWRKDDIESLNVIYGGSIPYNQIHEKLSKADACLLVSSFSPELFTHAKASIQTKITDYLKAKRLIISCGPDYSANHTFLKSNNCGICIETNNVVEVANILKNIFNKIENYQYMVDNGYKVLQDEFNFEVVQNKLKEFLANN